MGGRRDARSSPEGDAPPACGDHSARSRTGLHGAAPREVKYQRHDRHEEQQVNQGAGDVKHEPAQYPQDGKKNEQDKEHRVSPFGER